MLLVELLYALCSSQGKTDVSLILVPATIENQPYTTDQVSGVEQRLI